MEGWRRTLLPRIAENKKRLAEIAFSQLARRSGATSVDDGLILDFLGKTYWLTPDLSLLETKGMPAPEEIQALLFDYFLNARGIGPKGEWLGFRELPHGAFYAQAFQSYSGDELVRRLNREGFEKAAKRAGGVPLPMGDAAYAFRPLPLLAVAVVWWDGEEEIPPQATVLFDARASELLPTEGLAIVGRLLCRRLLKLAEGA